MGKPVWKWGGACPPPSTPSPNAIWRSCWAQKNPKAVGHIYLAPVLREGLAKILFPACLPSSFSPPGGGMFYLPPIYVFLLVLPRPVTFASLPSQVTRIQLGFLLNKQDLRGSVLASRSQKISLWMPALGAKSAFLKKKKKDHKKSKQVSSPVVPEFWQLKCFQTR